MRVAVGIALVCLAGCLIGWRGKASGDLELHGTVRMLADGSAVPGARVCLSTRHGRLYSSFETLSDSSGAWKVGGLPPGPYSVAASKDKLHSLPDFASSTGEGKELLGYPGVRLALTSNDSTQGVDLLLYSGYLVTGVVREEQTSRPLADVMVKLSSSEPATGVAFLSTDANGRFRFPHYLCAPGQEVELWTEGEWIGTACPDLSGPALRALRDANKHRPQYTRTRAILKPALGQTVLEHDLVVWRTKPALAASDWSMQSAGLSYASSVQAALDALRRRDVVPDNAKRRIN